MLRVLFIISSILFLLVGCNHEEKPLTNEEVLAFAKKIELSISQRDGKLMDDAMDEKALLKKMNLSGAKDQAVSSAFKEGINIGTKLANTLSPRGSYLLVKHYEKNNIHHLIFRMYDKGAINYHDLELKRTGGVPKIADIYIYITGENFSETLKSLYNQFAKEANNTAKKESDWTQRMPDIHSLINAGKYQDALDIYNEVPESIKRSRQFQILHVEICSGLTNEENEKALAEYESLYPHEPNMQLVLIDVYLMRREYNKALDAVNGLDKMIDNDPLLDYQRSYFYGMMDSSGKSRECLERLVTNMPDFEDGLKELIRDYLEHYEYEKAKPLVDRFRSKKEFDQTPLDNILYQFPGYKEKFGTN